MTASGTLSRRGTEHEVRDPIVDFYRDHVVIRGLPEGKGRIDVTVRHPFFLPSPRVEVAVDDVFDRGRVVSSSPVVAGIGGAVSVVHGTAAAARLTLPDGSRRIGERGEGRIEFPSLEPGVYEVELCADPTCTEIEDRRRSIEVGARQRVEVE